MCGETRIPRDMCVGKHASRGNTHPYDTGPIATRSRSGYRTYSHSVNIKAQSYQSTFHTACELSNMYLVWYQCPQEYHHLHETAVAQSDKVMAITPACIYALAIAHKLGQVNCLSWTRTRCPCCRTRRTD